METKTTPSEAMTLTHHGVKGQKWGVTRTPAQLGHPTKPKRTIKQKLNTAKRKITKKVAAKKAEKKAEEAKTTKVPEKTKTTQKPKSVKNMSDDELRRIINRMDMEKKYAQLTAPQKNKGMKIATEILGKAAMSTAQKYANQAMDKAVESMLKKAAKKKGG